jgi:hypothetical protein
MKDYINSDKTKDKEDWLAELFAEIDINGDKELSWEVRPNIFYRKLKFRRNLPPSLSRMELPQRSHR